MGTAAACVLWVLLALSLVLAGTAEEGVRRRSSGLRFQHELRRAWATSRRRAVAYRPTPVRLLAVEVRRSPRRTHDDA